MAYFGEEIKMYKKTGRRGDTGIITDTKVKPRSERQNWHQTSSFQNYERLCRGEVRNLVSWFLIRAGGGGSTCIYTVVNLPLYNTVHSDC